MGRGRLLALGLSLAALACGDKHDPPRPPDGKPAPLASSLGLTREQFIQVEIDSECARLRANADLGAIDQYREEALGKLGKKRIDRTASLSQFLDDAALLRDIAAKVKDCRIATGWVEQVGPDGVSTWVRSSN